MSVVLVTGASSGFGEAIAMAFADAGHRVEATMRRPENAPDLLRRRVGMQFSLGPLDVTDPASRECAIANVMRRYGRLDILINNAGIALMASFEDTAEQILRLVFETNYFGPCELMRLALPILRHQGGGRIVNISAIGAILTTPLLNAYCASKHALDCTSAALDIEARPFGVRVSSVLPGPFATAIGPKAPKVAPSEPYRPMFEQMGRTRAAGPPPPVDFTPVIAATLSAATDPDPQPRYLIPGGLASVLIDTMPELERLHQFEARRAGASNPA